MGSGAAVAGLLSAALYFTYFKSQRDSNENAQKSLEAKLQENRELEPYKTKLGEIERQLASLEQQMGDREAHRARRERSRCLYQDARR